MRFLVLLLALSAPLLSASAQNRPSSIIDSLEKVVATTKVDTTKARSLCRLCAHLRVAGQMAPALEKGEAGLLLARETGDREGEASCLSNIGVLYSIQGNSARGRDYFQKGLEIFREIGDRARAAGMLNNIGLSYASQGSYASALEYYEKSLKILEQTSDRSSAASTLNNIGVIYYNRGAFVRALEYFHRSLRIREATRDQRGAAESLTNIGAIHLEQADYARALEFYHKSLKISEEIGDDNSAAGALGNIGVIYKRKADYARALEYFKRSLKMAGKFGNSIAVTNALNNIGIIYYSQGQYARALEYFDKSLAIVKEAGDQIGMTLTLTNIALVKVNNDRPDDGRRLAEQALKIATEIGAPDHMQFAAYVISSADSALGDWKSAYEHYKLYKQYSDSLKNDEKSREIGRLEAKYDFDKETEARDREEARAAEQREMYIWAAAAAFAALLLFAGLLAWGFQTKRKANKDLTAKNAEISQQSEEIRLQNDVITQKNAELDTALAELRELSQFKESMTGMIVHDLKNPLNVVVGRAELTGDRQLKSAALQMHNLTINMLDVQKFEAAGVQLELAPVPARQIAAAALEQVAFLAEEKQITLVNDASPELWLSADETYLVRVLVNLLNNAVKFTPYGGTIRIEANNENGRANLTVTDSGPGIPDDKLDAVFDKFSKLEDKAGLNKKGTGLGLTFCKLAAEAHGGTIRAENAPEGGARFRLDLPAVQPPAGAAPVEIAEPEPLAAPAELTANDKAALAPVLAEIRKYDIYEMSEINEVLERLSESDSPGIAAWRRRTESALFALEEEAFAAALREAEG